MSSTAISVSDYGPEGRRGWGGANKSSAEKRFFVFVTISTPPLGLTNPRIQLDNMEYFLVLEATAA
jgi:hypothetical protein